MLLSLTMFLAGHTQHNSKTYLSIKVSTAMLVSDAKDLKLIEGQNARTF